MPEKISERKKLIMRILMVVRLFYPWIGGTERQAHKLAKKLSERDIDVKIVTGWWFRGTPQREVIDGIPVFRNQTLWEMFGVKGLRRFGGYLYFFSLLWYLWRHRGEYDLLHVHGLNYHAGAAALAGRWFHRRTLVKLANSGQASDIKKMQAGQQLPLSRFLLPAALSSDRFVATNHLIADELIAAGVPANRITKLPNGVEIDSVRAKLDFSLNDPVRLVFVGRLHAQKGLDVLLTAFKQLLSHHPQWHLHLQLLGDGPLREDLVALADDLGIASHVDFIGMTERVPEYLQQADIFVLPSRAEGHSNALLEAMACGLPVVVSDIPANLDVVEGGRNGLVFAVDDPRSLSAALARLLEQRELRARLGLAARETVEAQYSLDHIVDDYIALYREILSVNGKAQLQYQNSRFTV
jgi:glycosyltransferase involved in cell wall biosynthesis